MSDAAKNSIETKNLHVGYQQKNSVNLIQQNVSIQLAKGEFVGILGKNGIEEIVTIPLNDQEKAKLAESAEGVRKTNSLLDV